MIVAIILPLLKGVLSLYPAIVEAVGYDSTQVLVDDDTVYVEASYVETETTYDWHLEFQKKVTPNKQRLRIAIDQSATGFGTIANIRGQGLGQADNGDISTMKVADDNSNFDWFYTPDFSEESQTGYLEFSTEKTETVGQVPVVVSLDVLEEPSDPETEAPEGENQESPEASETPEDPEATEPEISEETEETETTETTEEEIESAIEETTEDTTDLEDTQAASDAEDLPEENSEDKNAFTGSMTLFGKNQQTPFVAGEGLPLGPFATHDTFDYVVSAVSEQKFPNQATDKFTTGFVTNGYTGAEAEANWKNYDYSKTDPTAEENITGSGHGQTLQLWGKERDFTNSYTSYNGAFVKKWVEPVTSGGKTQDTTTTYNVYIDVIGTAEEVTVKQKLDVVFVLDKSGSMTNNSDGKRKDRALKDAVTRTVTDLDKNENVDLRVGLVDFYGHDTFGMTANTASLTSNIDAVKNDPILTSDAKSSQGTPLSLGLQQGYKVLHDGGKTPEREKVLIVVGDGQPTVSFSGIKGINVGLNNGKPQSKPGVDKAWTHDLTALSDYWALNTNYQYLKNFGSSNYFSDKDELPTDFSREGLTDGYIGEGRDKQYRYYEFGEIEFPNRSYYFFGDGTSATTKDKTNAINTVAYNLWLQQKYTNTNANVYSIGIGLNNTGKTVLQNIGKDGYYDAKNTDELIAAMINITGGYGNTLKNATVYDELGSNVSLAGGSPEISYYKLSKNNNSTTKYNPPMLWESSNKNVEAASLSGKEGYKFTGISLGEGEMVRIKYQIELDYQAQNGAYYVTNKETYMVNGPDNEAEKRMYMALPAIRYLSKARDVVVKKQDIFGNPISGTTYEMSKGKESHGNATTDASGEAGFRFEFPGRNSSTDVFTIKEVSVPNQYQLLNKGLDFQVRKRSSLGSYTLTNETEGNSKSYNQAPAWWDQAGRNSDSWKTVYTDNDSFVFSINQNSWSQNDPFVHLTVQNQFKPIKFTVNKHDGNNPLPKARFELRGKSRDGKYATVLGSGESNGNGVVDFYDGEENLLTFDISKAEQSYRIYETKAPAGFEAPDANTYWEIQVVPEEQKVYYHKYGDEDNKSFKTFADISAVDKDTLNMSIDVENKKQKVDFIIIKEGNDTPLNGFGFELQDKDSEEIFKAYSGILETSQEAGPIWNQYGQGHFFKKTEGEKYQDLDFETAFEAEAGRYTISETDLLPGYKGSETDWELIIDEAGKFTLADNYSNATLNKTEVNNKTTWKLTIENEVLPFELDLEKLDSYTKNPLKEAGFTAAKLDSYGNWLAPVELQESSSEEGHYQLADLEIGTYKIEETVAPSGYQRLPGYFRLEITQRSENGNDDGNLSEKGSLMAEVQYYLNETPQGEKESIELEFADDKVSLGFVVTNDFSHPLPATGGIGRLGQFLIASALLVGSLFIGWLIKWLKRGEAGVHD